MLWNLFVTWLALNKKWSFPLRISSFFVQYSNLRLRKKQLVSPISLELNFFAKYPRVSRKNNFIQSCIRVHLSKGFCNFSHEIFTKLADGNLLKSRTYRQKTVQCWRNLRNVNRKDNKFKLLPSLTTLNSIFL